jgi:hypothetical protein
MKYELNSKLNFVLEIPDQAIFAFKIEGNQEISGTSSGEL